MKKKLLIPLFSFITIISMLLSGCGSADSEATPTPYPTPVRKTYTVSRGDIIVNAEMFGQVAPKALETAYFEMNGHVGEVYVQVNNVVKKGQLLADLTEFADIQRTAYTTRDEIRAAQINVKMAENTLERYQAENRPSYEIENQELQIELAQIDLNKILLKYGIDPTSDALAALDAKVEEARLYSPVDGVIITAVAPGRVVTDETPAFTIGDGIQMEIVVNLNSGESNSQIREMFEEMEVIVSPNDKPEETWVGTITQLPSPYGTGASNDQTIHLVVNDAPPADDYKSGDTVTVVIELANKSGVLWLPPAAIRQVGGRTFVIVNGENGPKRVDIEIGLKTADKIEILTGLTEGQVVVGP